MWRGRVNNMWSQWSSVMRNWYRKINWLNGIWILLFMGRQLLGSYFGVCRIPFSPRSLSPLLFICPYIYREDPWQCEQVKREKMLFTVRVFTLCGYVSVFLCVYMWFCVYMFVNVLVRVLVGWFACMFVCGCCFYTDKIRGACMPVCVSAYVCTWVYAGV